MRRLLLAALLFALPAWAAAPSYVGNGGIAALFKGTSIDVAYPNPSNNDIVILIMASSSTTDDVFSAVSNFNGPIDTQHQTGNWHVAWYWKRANGAEGTGTEACGRNSGSGTLYGLMVNYSGCITTETPYSQAATAGGQSTSASSSSITPNTDNARIVCFINVEDNVSVGTLTGGNYAEDYELASSEGGDTSLAADSYGQTTATTEGAQTSALGGSEYWITYTMALKSEAEPEPTGRRRSNTSG